MKLHRVLGPLLTVAALFCGGCIHVSSRADPKTNLSDFKKFYVIHTLVDGRGVDRLIARELRRRGYDATYGSRTEMPPKVDAVVIYDDHWETDMSTYMYSLDVQIRTPRSDRPLAVAFVKHPSLTLTGGNPQRLVDKIVNKLFVQKTPLDDLPFPSRYPDFGIQVGPPPAAK
jgi:hypothetical protein